MIRGIVAILLGVMTFIWPGITLTALVLLFGAYALIDGIVSIVGAVRAAEAHERWGSLVFEGVAGIGAAVVTVLWPAITAFALVCLIAAWAVVTGIFELVTAVRMRKHIPGEWLLVVTGIASVVFGVLLFLAPLAGALVIALWVGIYLLVTGVLLMSLGFRLRAWGKTSAAHGGTPVPVH